MDYEKLEVAAYERIELGAMRRLARRHVEVAQQRAVSQLQTGGVGFEFIRHDRAWSPNAESAVRYVEQGLRDAERRRAGRLSSERGASASARRRRVRRPSRHPD